MQWSYKDYDYYYYLMFAVMIIGSKSVLVLQVLFET